ncbi:hypothetical protein DEM34_18820 [Spiribacter halobius]|uniref:ISXO2-like transposase domain-containing protein n=1 Tax=Sediminicurvatus halobius TaxID=2182432 RepID=A0A2U2MVU0_9GAMM|nr:hypothetical protein DEM34_18820 [Spiribacter halobius]
MAEREQRYRLSGHVRLDYAYLGGERWGGKAGRGSENKIGFLAAVSLSDEGHPLRTRLTPVATFTSEVVKRRAEASLVPGSTASSDGLACFCGVTATGCTHRPTLVAARASQANCLSCAGSARCSATPGLHNLWRGSPQRISDPPGAPRG